MYVFPFVQVKDVSVLYSLDSDLAVAAETLMSPGYVAKVICLAKHLEPEKNPIVQTGMEANLDVSTLFMFRTLKKVLLLAVLRHISDHTLC